MIIGSEYTYEYEGDSYTDTHYVDLYCDGEKLGNATVEDVR
jgi:hypothetical protein